MTKHCFALQVNRWGYNLTRIERRRILTLMIGFFLLIFPPSGIFTFMFAAMLCLSLGPLITDLISAKNFRAVDFSSMNKWIGENISAGAISTVFARSTPSWKSHVEIAAVADPSTFLFVVQDGFVHGPLRSLGSQRRRQISFQLLWWPRMWHLFFILQTFKVNQTCHYFYLNW